MKLLFTSYVNTPQYQDPDAWLEKIEAYAGILKELGTSHEVQAIEHINYDGFIKKDNVGYLFLNLGKRFHRSPSAFHKIIGQLEPDIVFINGFNFPLQLILLKHSLPKQTKLVVLHRAERPFKGIKKWFQKFADRYVSAYLFSSKDFLMDWKNNISSKKMHEVMQASSVFHLSDQLSARTNLNIGENEKIYLWVGNLNPGKDPITVVRAFIEFRKKHQDVKLYMIFQSNHLLPEIQALIKTESMHDVIVLVGKVQHRQLEDWYNAADFFISGSHYEGGGTAVAEAMSCGCIPILTNISSFRGISGNGYCGILYEPANVPGLIEKLHSTFNIDIAQERIKVLEQFDRELSFKAIANKINCIIGAQNDKRFVSPFKNQYHPAHVQQGRPH